MRRVASALESAPHSASTIAARSAAGTSPFNTRFWFTSSSRPA